MPEESTPRTDRDHYRYGGVGAGCLTALYWVIWQSQTAVSDPLVHHPQSIQIRETILFLVFCILWLWASAWMINPENAPGVTP